MCVDAMASIECDQDVILFLFEVPPASISPLWLANLTGVATLRVISL